MITFFRSNVARAQMDSSQLTPYSPFTDAEIKSLVNEANRMFLRDSMLLQDCEDVTITNGVGTFSGKVMRVERIEIDSVPVDWVYRDAFPEDLPITTF